MHGDRCRPDAVLEPCGLDVARLVLAAIAVHDDQRGPARRHIGLAAVTDTRVDFAAVDGTCRRQHGAAQRHRAQRRSVVVRAVIVAFAHGLAPVEPDAVRTTAEARDRDEAVLRGRAIVVRRTRFAPRASTVGAESRHHVVGIHAARLLLQPVRGPGAAAGRDDRGKVGPVDEPVSAGCHVDRCAPALCALPLRVPQAELNAVARLEPAHHDRPAVGGQVWKARAGCGRRRDECRRAQPGVGRRWFTAAACQEGQEGEEGQEGQEGQEGEEGQEGQEGRNRRGGEARCDVHARHHRILAWD